MVTPLLKAAKPLRVLVQLPSQDNIDTEGKKPRRGTAFLALPKKVRLTRGGTIETPDDTIESSGPVARTSLMQPMKKLRARFTSVQAPLRLS